MNWKALSFIVCILLMAACAPEKKETATLPKPVDAALQVPETAGINEAVTFSAKVTQNGESVDDADEVKYEIWKEGFKESSEMLDAAAEGAGAYTVSKTFEEAAVYHVQVHVVARGQHTMPKAAITIENTQ